MVDRVLAYFDAAVHSLIQIRTTHPALTGFVAGFILGFIGASLI